MHTVGPDHPSHRRSDDSPDHFGRHVLRDEHHVDQYHVDQYLVDQHDPRNQSDVDDNHHVDHLA